MQDPYQMLTKVVAHQILVYIAYQLLIYHYMLTYDMVVTGTLRNLAMNNLNGSLF